MFQRNRPFVFGIAAVCALIAGCAPAPLDSRSTQASDWHADNYVDPPVTISPG